MNLDINQAAFDGCKNSFLFLIADMNPNPNNIHPIAGYDKEIYVKPSIKNPNIIAGDFTI